MAYSTYCFALAVYASENELKKEIKKGKKGVSFPGYVNIQIKISTPFDSVYKLQKFKRSQINYFNKTKITYVIVHKHIYFFDDTSCLRPKCS